MRRWRSIKYFLLYVLLSAGQREALAAYDRRRAIGDAVDLVELRRRQTQRRAAAGARIFNPPSAWAPPAMGKW